MHYTSSYFDNDLLSVTCITKFVNDLMIAILK